MTRSSNRDIVAAGASALLLGLVLAPWGFVAIGALSGFRRELAFVLLPALSLACLDLGLESFSMLHGFRWLRRLAAVVSSVVVLGSLAVLSRFTLVTQSERLGLVATFWLGAALLWVLASLRIGEAGPEARLRPHLAAPGHRRAVAVVCGLLTLLLLAAAVRHAITPPAFIG